MGYQPGNMVIAKEENPLAKPIESLDDIFKFFSESYKKPNEVVIGMEVEKHGIHKSNNQPITYLEQNGLRKIQEKMIDELDWKIEKQEGKFIKSMSRGGTRLTLEIGESMSELSGRTHPSIHDLARELRMHQHELSEISKLFDTVWLGIGHQPFSSGDDIRMVPIRRFEIWSAYAKKRSPFFKESMKKNASVQANIDFTSEEDMRKKFQILLKLAPMLAGMYAHSPLREGKNSGYVSYRTFVIQQLDRRRFGIRKKFFSKNFGFKDWMDFCLKIPMIAIYRNDDWVPVKRLTFNQFLKSGYEGFTPTLEDWVMHLSWIYTDVRIRQYLELRVCDSVPPFLIPSMQAIVKAFVYHKDGEKALNDITKKWHFQDFATIYRGIAKSGMQTQIHDIKLLDYCKEVINVASSLLQGLKVLNEKQEDESIHLHPIKDFVLVKEKSPGQWLIENWEGEWKKNPEKLIEWCSFEQLT